MKKNPIPSYLKHGQKDQARAVWTDPTGTRRFKLLPGKFNSKESREAYGRLVAEIAASPSITPSTLRSGQDHGISVSEMILAYVTHAETYYRDSDGSATNEYRNILLALRTVRELYGETSAADFGPLKLKVVRQKMIDSGIVRSQVNKRIDRIRRAFRWATSEELVPPSVYDSLKSLPGLRTGRTEAIEGEPVKPVDDETINATLPHLPKHVRVMVELMANTGMRPGEVCGMTLNQIERGSAIWIYRPARHKTSHLGKGRMIPLGPRGREILSAFLAGQILEPDEPIFSPKRARDERMAERSANRKTPRWGSHLKRNDRKRKAKPQREPGTHYNPMAIAHAVKRACKLAGVEPWNPYRLRHSFASRIRKAHGLEAAQVLLGHSRADVTQVYAERNESLALKVAAQVG